MSRPRLAGTVVVVAVRDGADLARRLVAEGATVVLTGAADGDVGELLRDLEGGPGRVALFDGSDADALVEFLGEQFAERPPVS